MARMPQIPAPEIRERPEGRAARFESPDVNDVTAPFKEGAQAAAALGNDIETAQAQNEAARAKLQKVADGVTATRMVGDHAEKLRNLAEQLQQQFWDTPDKFPDEFRRQSQALTDSEIAAAPNQQVASDFSQKSALVDNQHLTQAHSWSIMRTAQKTKSDVTGLIAAQVRTAQSMSTIGGLTAAIRDAAGQVQPLVKNTHGDPDGTITKLQHDMAAAWVEANSPDHPADVALALDKKTGPLAQYLSPKELAQYQRRAQSDQKGYDERQRFQVIKEAADHGDKSYELYLKGQLNSTNVFQMKNALEQKQAAIGANPNLSDKEKEQQTGVVQKQLDTLRYLDEAARKGGHFDAAFDQGKQTKLFNDLQALGKPGDKTPKDIMKLVELRHDLAEAQASRAISDSRAATINKALSQMTGKSLAAEGKNVGWHVPMFGYVKQNPQQAGNAKLNDYFDSGAFGKLSDEQKNDARWAYMEQVVDAQENGRNLDAVSAEKMAHDAVISVTKRSRTGGK